MITAVFGILMILIFGKLAIFALKMAWGILRFTLTIVFLPLMLIGMVIGGLIKLAFVILIIVGIITLVKTVF